MKKIKIEKLKFKNKNQLYQKRIIFSFTTVPVDYI